MAEPITDDKSGETPGEKKVKLWDFPVRLFHWALVAAIVTSWWTNQQVMIDLHAIAGYTILALVLFRIIWGFVGSSNARFSSFLTGPKRVLDYASKVPKGSVAELTYAGHNPAGGWMVVVLLVLVGIQAVSGLFASEDTFLFFDGPLVAYASSDVARIMNWIHLRCCWSACFCRPVLSCRQTRKPDRCHGDGRAESSSRTGNVFPDHPV